MNNCIVLLGVKHAGKTTTGQILANRKNLPFFDIDNIIEQQIGESCRNIYNKDGDKAFKNAETNACQFFVEAISTLTLDHDIKGVVATGGGICDNSQALEVLRAGGLFIYLDVPKHIAFERILKSSKKEGSFPAYLAKTTPPSEDNMRIAFYEIYKKRATLYHSIADIIIDTENLQPEMVCDAIITAL